MYRDPYPDDRCPVCGARNGACPAGAGGPVPHPFDPATSPTAVVGGPLRMYLVTAWGTDTIMQLNDSDAARYGADAVLI